MRKIYLIVILFFIFILSYPQKKYSLNNSNYLNECFEKISEINSIPLKRAYIGIQWDNKTILSTDKHLFDDTIATHAIYMDSIGKIRKYIRSTYEESLSLTIICYYNAEGYMINIIYNLILEGYDPDVLETKSNGYIYMNNDTILLEDHKLQVVDLDGTQFVHPLDKIVDNKYLNKSFIELNNYQTIGTLIDSLNIDDKAINEILSSLPIIIFDGYDEEISYINRNDVFVRDAFRNGESLGSIIDKVDAGTIFMSRGNESSEWIKVTHPYNGVEGYVFYKFLEPTERVIKKEY